MKAPPRPSGESERLEALMRLGVLDTPAEQALDDLTSLAAHICGAPIALISFIDDHRQWFKSRVGLDVTETPRDISFCAHAIVERDVLVVSDTALDDRFADNPLVAGDPHIRFYAGAPLIAADGHALGTLCVIDRVARQLTPPQLAALRVLSRQVMAQLELGRQARALVDSERLLRGLIDGLGPHLFVGLMTPDGVIVDANRPALEAAGLTREDVLGRRVEETPWFAYSETVQRQLRAAVERAAAGEPVRYDVQVRVAGDARIWLDLTICPLRNANGTVTYLVPSANVIDERKRAEDALRESEAQYRTLFDYAPDGIVITDTAGSYLDANDSMCRMLGYSRAELVGMPSSDIVAPSEVQHITAALDAIANQTAYHRTWELRRKDGTTFAADVIATSMPDGNLLGMVRDVTERQKLEQQFLRAQRMESLGTLAGGIAHDLNNVLTPILMSVEILKEQVGSRHGLDLLATLQGSAERGAALVKQVLSFARGVEGRHVVVDVAPLAQDLIGVLRDTFPKSIDLQFEPAPDLWSVTGDPTQLHQVLMNLCVNARDAMAEGGTLSLRIVNVVLDEIYAGMNVDAQPGAYVMIRVADTGIGMARHVQDRIFEPFFTTKVLGQGTGLGLSTTMAIVKSHGGFMHVYSETGKGTKFKVYLPANTTPHAADRVQADQSGLPRGHGELVLVVDDEEAIRRIAAQTLERFGYRVVVAANGAEAVAVYVAHRHEIAAVLTDMAMPIMDGPALVLALRALNAAVRIIGSSGLASNDSLARAVGAGVQSFVPKPYTADALLRTLDQVLRRADES